MDTSYRTRLETFTEDDLPDLDEVVLGALEYLHSVTLPQIATTTHTRPLVVGSGNAIQTGRILFRDTGAYFADESQFEHVLTHAHPDAIYIISASGGKHAIAIAQKAKEAGLPSYLLTAQENAPARIVIGDDHTVVYPHIREPYTYNTSTYLSMLLGQKRENPESILSYILDSVQGLLPKNFKDFTSFIFVVPSAHEAVRKMFETKFDELFGPHVQCRACTPEEMKHAKTVVTAPFQCFIGFGEEISHGNPGLRITIPLPQDPGPALVIAAGYYIIGKIQKSHPPYFKQRIDEYARETSLMFGQTITPIVE